MGQTAGCETCCSSGNSGELLAQRPQNPATAAPGVNLDKLGTLVDAAPRGRQGEESAAKGGGFAEEEPSTHTYEDGSTYKGQLVSGKRHGHGEWRSATAGYVGHWHEDAMHGRGKHTWTDGRVYEGEFRNGKFSGQGRMEWHAQKGVLVYEGEYLDDMKHGHGKFLWADGRAYDGQWSMGKRDGKGTYTDAQGVTKAGIWKANKFEGWEDGAEPNVERSARPRLPTGQSELEKGLPGNR